MAKTFSQTIKFILFEKQKGQCAYCKCDLMKEIHRNILPGIDHIIPISQGGNDNLENLCLVCKWCNSVKRNKNKDDFLKYIQPYLEGKVSKKDLREYNLFLKLQKKFKHLL